MSDETQQDGSGYIEGTFVAFAALGAEIAALRNEVERLKHDAEIANHNAELRVKLDAVPLASIERLICAAATQSGYSDAINMVCEWLSTQEAQP